MAVYPVDFNLVCNHEGDLSSMVNNKGAGLMVVETPGLVPTQFRPHRTLGLFQIGANMVWDAAIN